MSAAPPAAAELPSPWRRRLVVLLVYGVATTLVAMHFLVSGPNVERERFRVKSEIAALQPGGDLPRQKEQLDKDFESLLMQNSVDRALLVSAFVLGAAGLLAGGAWAFLDQRRAARL